MIMIIINVDNIFININKIIKNLKYYIKILIFIKLFYKYFEDLNLDKLIL